MSRDLVIIIVVVICLLAFGFSDVGLIVQGNKNRTTSNACGYVPQNLTYFELDKSIMSIWNWKYESTYKSTDIVLQ